MARRSNVLSLFEGCRNKEDNGYKKEIVYLISDFIMSNNLSIKQCIDLKDSGRLEQMVLEWLDTEIKCEE